MATPSKTVQMPPEPMPNTITRTLKVRPKQADKAAQVVSPNNVTTASSVDKHGSSSQPGGAEEAAKAVSPNTGTTANANSGAHAGNSNNSGGRTVNNSGTFNGHGNGGLFDGNFDASTRNYYKY